MSPPAGADGPTMVAIPFGQTGDVPITGDWDGSGASELGIYDPNNETFYLHDANGNLIRAQTLGQANDVPVTGDWTGSGKTQLGVWDPSTAAFYLREVPKPAPPVVTAPVPTPLPVAPPGTAAHPRVRTKIVISWTWGPSRTRIYRVQVGKLPRGGRIAVRCAGRGCPFTTRSATAQHVRRLARRPAGTAYRPGDHLVVAVSAPGRISERAGIKIRKNRKPLAAAL